MNDWLSKKLLGRMELNIPNKNYHSLEILIDEKRNPNDSYNCKAAHAILGILYFFLYINHSELKKLLFMFAVPSFVCVATNHKTIKQETKGTVLFIFLSIYIQ